MLNVTAKDHLQEYDTTLCTMPGEALTLFTFL